MEQYIKDIIGDKLCANQNCSDEIINAFDMTDQIINHSEHEKILCSISGGADSDIILDICYKVDYNKKITYIFFDTGIECQATHRHLDYLEERYGIKIQREKASLVVPLGVKKYGYPFLTKDISGKIELLQKYNFDFSDRPYEELLEQYPNCSSALKWWCNLNKGRFNIKAYPYLKEWMIQTPPHLLLVTSVVKVLKRTQAKNI